MRTALLEDAEAFTAGSEAANDSEAGDNLQDYVLRVQGAEVAFKDLRYSVRTSRCGGKTNRKEILHGLSGRVHRSKLNTLFGATGSGKSSLMDVLAMRKRASNVMGSVFVDGIPQSEEFREMAGYVAQDDHLVSNLTCRENVLLSADLRLPASCAKSEKLELVQGVLDALGLDTCADTLVGDDFRRGLSGGEKKRTSIAMELVVRPPVLFLDEPTSGLDSTTSVAVVAQLLALSRLGCTILMAIHQPRFAIFRMLDHVMLLDDGSIIHQGEARRVVDDFASLGFHCETFNNPADFMLDVLGGLVPRNANAHLDAQNHAPSAARSHPDLTVFNPSMANGSARGRLQTSSRRRRRRRHRLGQRTSSEEAEADIEEEDAEDSDDAFSSEAEGFDQEGVGPTLHSSLERDVRAWLLLAWQRDPAHLAILSYVNSLQHASARTRETFAVPRHLDRRPGWWAQFCILSRKNLVVLSRLPAVVLMQFVVMCFFGALTGGIYHRLGLDGTGLTNRIGAFFYLIMSLVFANLSAIELFLKERTLYIHQRHNHFYHPLPYFASLLLCDLLPMRVVPIIAFSSIVYPMMGFQPHLSNFAWFVATVVVESICAGTLCYMMSAAIGIFVIANLAVSVAFVVSMIYGGVLVDLSSLPAGLRWLEHFSFFKYGYEALAVTELHGLQFHDVNAPGDHITGDQILLARGLSIDNRVYDIIAMLLLAVLFAALAYAFLLRIARAD
ncbi:ABC transporter G family member 1 [Hondaea fermentalgiana]|uniref:ABC transporter G family member 1 n=1 Tax=Hondaea fermentalgiana TaxID=2315210 RepID=A0A2R5GSQ2_9STRA|nr:ABC transporter G family member 1 [Hondaea fermentalgiana]|eukprot:GBG33892.1 ABC transporter G family member 1 [Hondaea fermentalgiana]